MLTLGIVDANSKNAKEESFIDPTIDLAPTVEDAYYMPWEIIQWPLATAKRWHLSRSYMRYMGALAHA